MFSTKKKDYFLPLHLFLVDRNLFVSMKFLSFSDLVVVKQPQKLHLTSMNNCFDEHIFIFFSSFSIYLILCAAFSNIHTIYYLYNLNTLNDCLHFIASFTFHFVKIFKSIVIYWRILSNSFDSFWRKVHQNSDDHNLKTNLNFNQINNRNNEFFSTRCETMLFYFQSSIESETIRKKMYREYQFNAVSRSFFLCLSSAIHGEYNSNGLMVWMLKAHISLSPLFCNESKRIHSFICAASFLSVYTILSGRRFARMHFDGKVKQ